MPPEAKTPLDTFVSILENLDRDGAVSYALSLLDGGRLTLPELYEQVLAPALNRIQVPREREDALIWREHLQSAIVQKVMGACYPHVQKAREASGAPGKGKRVMLACPQEEYHEIGVSMGADFFVILGYEVAYVGCNTPRDTLLSAAADLKPDLVVLSVTNYLNLAQLPVLITALKERRPEAKVMLSGSALRHTGRSAADFHADGAVQSFEDVRMLAEVTE